MHYLIMGGGGFIGCRLALRVLAGGNKVTILDNYAGKHACRACFPTAVP